MLRFFLYALLLFPMALVADTVSDTQAIDAQIQQLEQQRKTCKLQAGLAGRNADRMMTQDWLSYKREIQKQEMMEGRMGEIDQEIKDLKQKKQNLLNKGALAHAGLA